MIMKLQIYLKKRKLIYFLKKKERFGLSYEGSLVTLIISLRGWQSHLKDLGAIQDLTNGGGLLWVPGQFFYFLFFRMTLLKNQLEFV
jgi:hypothetical protein